MTPEEKQQLQELIAWKEQKERQQLSYPVDDASRSALGATFVTGAGNTALTQVLSATPGAVPKAYARTFILLANGVQYEVPSLI